MDITFFAIQHINANPNGKACTFKCFKEGAKLVLYDEEAGTVYALADQVVAWEHVGRVRVTGVLEGRVLSLETVEDLESSERPAS